MNEPSCHPVISYFDFMDRSPEKQMDDLLWSCYSVIVKEEFKCCQFEEGHIELNLDGNLFNHGKTYISLKRLLFSKSVLQT